MPSMTAGEMRTSSHARVWIAALMLLIDLTGTVGRAQYILQDAQDSHRYEPGNLILPFVFYSPTYRFGGGLMFDGTGLIQPQTDTSLFVWGSSNGTYSISLSESDLELFPFDRLFLDAESGYRQDQDYTAYISGNPEFPDQPAGTNTSAQENYLTTHGIDVYGNITLKYLLPIGGGANSPVAHYTLENGILQKGVTGGSGWNPLSTGRTYLLFNPFVEDLSLRTPLDNLDQSTHRRHYHGDENGIRFGLFYDNTDYPLNPSSGNTSRVTFTRDFGWFNSTTTWSNLSGEYTQYIDLGKTPWFRQRVIALDLWTSYSLTWDEHTIFGTRTLGGAPPFYDGATLGGDTRLRAYAENRFWDRAALFGAAELRLTPNWNPLGDIKLLKFADITWMQWAVFVEAGRVADAYSAQLLGNLKADAGIGLRILANDTLVRLDVAASHEGFAVRAQLSQPF